MKKVKVGIVGMGVPGRRGGEGFIDIFRETGRAEVIAVCDYNWGIYRSELV